MAAGLAALCLAGVLAWLRPTRTAEIASSGRTLVLPLPTWSVRLSGGEGSARYLSVGDPVFAGRLGAFTHVEQMGSGHLLTGESVRLILVTQKRTRLFTEVEIRVEPPGP